MDVRVGPAAYEDLPHVLALLEENGLPKAGLEGLDDTTLVAREGGRILGSAALELYGEWALLRSVAVAQDSRGAGVGGSLTRAALRLARERGVRRAYLLTETADGFFPRFGFSPVERSEVPREMRHSVEFVSACPSSARAMAADLTG